MKEFNKLPVWNREQKVIRKQIKQERGRYFFLSDLYNEIDTDIKRTNTYYQKRWKPTKTTKKEKEFTESKPEFIIKVE